jgi:hypothetical protein
MVLNPLPIPASLDGCFPSGLIHQNSPHRFSGSFEKVSPVLPI